VTVYEYEFGVYVEADNEQDAWEKVREISEALDKIDVEGTSTTDGPTEVTPTVLHQIDLRKQT